MPEGAVVCPRNNHPQRPRPSLERLLEPACAPAPLPRAVDEAGRDATIPSAAPSIGSPRPCADASIVIVRGSKGREQGPQQRTTGPREKRASRLTFRIPPEPENSQLRRRELSDSRTTEPIHPPRFPSPPADRGNAALDFAAISSGLLSDERLACQHPRTHGSAGVGTPFKTP